MIIRGGERCQDWFTSEYVSSKCEVIARNKLQPTGSLGGGGLSQRKPRRNKSHWQTMLLTELLRQNVPTCVQPSAVSLSVAVHDALILLHSSLSTPKLIHSLRCTLCANKPILFTYDTLLLKGISLITNFCLNDVQWTQASLPIRDGGLGIRRLSALALSVFCASAANTPDLQDRMLVVCNIGVLQHGGVGSGHRQHIQRSEPCSIETNARRQRSKDEHNVTIDENAL